jgi:hypothetical protein
MKIVVYENETNLVIVSYPPERSKFKQGVKTPPALGAQILIRFHYVPDLELFAARLDKNQLTPSLWLPCLPYFYPKDKLDTLITSFLASREEMTSCTCFRCSNVWVPRKPNPVNCPKCRSILWNVKRERKLDPANMAANRMAQPKAKPVEPQTQPEEPFDIMRAFDDWEQK